MTLVDGRIVGRQLAVDRVELVDKHPVEAEIGDHGEAVRLVEVDRVGMRGALPLRVENLALVLDEIRGGPELAVGPDRQHGHAAAAVVGHEHVLARGVDHQVARPVADRRLLVEPGQLAGLGVKGERRHSAPFAGAGALVHRVEVFPRRMHRQE